jgi:hypothetical protein
MRKFLLAVPVALALAACATQSKTDLAAKAADADCPEPVARVMDNRRVAAPASYSPVSCAMRAAWYASDITARNNRRNLATPAPELPAS